MRRQSDVFFGERESGQDVRQTNGAWSEWRARENDGRRHVRLRLLLKDLSSVCARSRLIDRADYDDDDDDDRWVVQTRKVRKW